MARAIRQAACGIIFAPSAGVEVCAMSKSEYMVTCDAEIMFTGTKAQCLNYFDFLGNPMPMTLHRISKTWDLRRDRREMR